MPQYSSHSVHQNIFEIQLITHSVLWSNPNSQQLFVDLAVKSQTANVIEPCQVSTNQMVG